MSAIDKDALLKGIDAENPCGDDLEYDAAFGALERMAQSKPEQQYGDTIIAAEEPDWREVRKSATALFERTKDLRICVHLAKALIRTDGYTGFADALSVMRTLIVDHWDGVHPRLDPDDDNDPTMRVNTLISLCDGDEVLRALRDAPLVRSAAVGQFGLRDLAVAAGDITEPSGEHPSDEGLINAAFMDAPVEDLQSTAGAIAQSIDDITTIESAITAQVGTTNAPNMEALVDVLKEAKAVLAERLSRRGIAADDAGGDAAAADQEQAPDGAAPSAAAVQRITGDITTREDVIRTLDKVCKYYDRYEPSSPVPLLIKRAKRLASMNFLEALRDLAPDGVTQAELISGTGGDGEAGE